MFKIKCEHGWGSRLGRRAAWFRLEVLLVVGDKLLQLFNVLKQEIPHVQSHIARHKQVTTITLIHADVQNTSRQGTAATAQVATMSGNANKAYIRL